MDQQFEDWSDYKVWHLNGMKKVYRNGTSRLTRTSDKLHFSRHDWWKIEAKKKKKFPAASRIKQLKTLNHNQVQRRQTNKKNQSESFLFLALHV